MHNKDLLIEVEWLHNHPMNFLRMATNSSLDLYLYIFIIVIHDIDY